MLDLRDRRTSVLVPLLLAALCLFARCATAAPDDQVITAQEQQQQQQRHMVVRNHMNEQQFLQWILPGSTTIESARQTAQRSLDLYIAAIDQHCALSDEQRERLQLTGRVDIETILSDFQDIWTRVSLLDENDRQNKGWQEFSPLQSRVNGGLFNENSFFYKSVRHSLSEEQFEQFQEFDHRRRRIRFQSAIDAALLDLSGKIGLRHHQRNALRDLAMQLQPPRRFSSHMAQYVVIYQITTLPRAKAKQLFDERQWKLLEPRFLQARGYEQYLIQEGVIEKKAPSQQ